MQLGHQPGGERLLGRDQLAGEQHLGREAAADRTHQPLGAAAARQAADLGLGQPESRATAAMRMSQASAISRPPPTATPLSAAITGLLKASSGAVRRGRVTMGLAAMLECRHIAGGGEIDAGAEGGAGAGEDHDPDRDIVFEARERLRQRVAGRIVDGVALIGAVEREAGDAALARDLEIAHHSTSSFMSRVHSLSERPSKLVAISRVCSPRSGGGAGSRLRPSSAEKNGGR